MNTERPSRGRPPKSRVGATTRSRLTVAAAQLMRRRGYHATGLSEVVERSRAPKGSLYHYFPRGKEQLASEALAESAQAISEMIEQAFAESRDPATAIRSFGDMLARNLRRCGYRDGCPIATVASDAADSPALRLACANGFLSWRDVIATELVRHGFPEAEATHLGTVVLSGFEGALLLARTLRDVEPLRNVAETLAALVGTRG